MIICVPGMENWSITPIMIVDSIVRFAVGYFALGVGDICIKSFLLCSRNPSRSPRLM